MTLETLPIKITTREQALQFLAHYDHLLFDCDGVLWLDEAAIPGVVDFVAWLQAQGKTLAFVTNNSSKSRNTYVDKFKRLGFKNVEKSAIYPTCYSAALILRDLLNLPQGSKVWVLGDEGIEQELTECGYVPVGGTDPRLNEEWSPDAELMQVDPEVKAVVVGLTKQINYMRIASTTQYLLAKESLIPFVGANIDRTYPGPKGMILPAGGLMVLLMSQTCLRDFINVGKPSETFLTTILETQGFNADRTLMVGDTLYTDIKFGNDGNLGGTQGGSLLVLSGGTSEAVMNKNTDESMAPKFYIESLGHLMGLISE